MHTFIPGIDMSFDKGGILSRSRMNPVWQYNKDKQNKYFFVLANKSKKKYFAQHINVYRGQNEGNINIPDCICEFPTTQKVSSSFFHTDVNIQYETFALTHNNGLYGGCFECCYAKGISNIPNGLQWLHIDNCYSAGTCFVILCDVHGILTSGTVHVNRVGWPYESMNLSVQTHGHETSKCLYDKTNKLLAIQWVENKVVNCISSLDEVGLIPVQRGKASVMLNLTYEI